jgi:hypothetical protein
VIKRRGYLWANLRGEIEQMFAELGRVHSGDVKTMIAKDGFKFLPSEREREIEIEEWLETRSYPLWIREGLAGAKRKEREEAIKRQRGDFAHVKWNGKRVAWKETVAKKKEAGVCSWPQCSTVAVAGVVYCEAHWARLAG